MEDNAILRLQNGSDIRGVAITTENGEKTLTRETVGAIGAALAVYLKQKLGKEKLRIAVGNDSRITAQEMFKYLCSGLCSEGAKVTYTGLSSTPAMFMSTVMPDYEYDAGIMITASHLPYDRNGFKIFTRNGGFEKSDIKAVLTLAQDMRIADAEGVYDTRDIMDAYSASLCDTIIKKAGCGNKPLSGLHIIIDAGNGAGGFFETKVLRALGANTEGSVATAPDGNFPTHAPNPEDKEAMASFSRAVKEAKADLGIIFDTDVDRAAVVLSDGSEINRNRLIALMTTIVKKDHEKPVIVTDSVTSTGLAEFIEGCGAVHRRFKRGYRNVINEAVRLCAEGEDACLAIETSGHGAMKENSFLDDGAYMAALITARLAELKAENRYLSDLIADLKEPVESTEIRFKVLESDFAAYGEKVLCALKERVLKEEGLSLAPDNFEGVRINADKTHGDGWFLLRLSLHDPVLPLNIESNSKGGVCTMQAWITEFLSEFKGLSL